MGRPLGFARGFARGFALARILGSALLVGTALLPAVAGASDPETEATRYSGTPVDVLTYHYDNLRTGWNPTEADLTPATVKSARFGVLKTLSVNGDVLAQPLLVSGFRLADGSLHDLLLVVTEQNDAYAFDAQSYATLWHVNLGTPQSSADLGCPHVHPRYGISSTPVVVRTGPGQASLYLVAATQPQSREFHTLLHQLDVASGQDLRPAVEIVASSTLSDGSSIAYKPADQWIRAGLAAAGGSIYIAASSHCDNNAGNISGWLIRYAADLTRQAAFSTIASPAGYELAAIWMSGFAPAIDAGGNVFAITGNGNFARGGKDWGESVIRLPPTLKKVNDFFTPNAYKTLNASDRDFGSGGVMLLPVQAGQAAPPLAVAMGKDAVLYLLDRTNLGKTLVNDAGALQARRLAGSGGGVWGGPAYFEGPAGGLVYYQLSSDVLRSFSVATGTAPALTPQAQGSTKAGFGGSLPVVSSNGSKAGSGVVWLVRRASPVQLEAYDAEKLGAPIFSASAGSWSAGNAFLTPMEANGRVYVGASGTVTVFGLAP